MKKTIFILFLFSILFSESDLLAAKKKYMVSEIPEILKVNAKAVVRVDETVFTINSIGRASKKIKYAITILKKNGDGFAVFRKYYTKLSRIANISINIYDKEGSLIKKVKSSDIKDYSANSGYSLYAENRLKYYKPVINSYPYTIEYEYSLIYDGLLNYPVWQPIDAYNLSVMQSSFQVNVPDKIGFRYKESKIDVEIKSSEKKNEKTYTWILRDFEAIKSKSFSPYLYEYTPIVYTAPKKFEIEGYVGNMQNWKSFGTWIYGLNSGLDELPSETFEKLKNLTANDSSTIEKVKKVYQYMQNKTRYVSIQLGIGSWQPFSAATVDEVGYGDCKALSNYMFAMLKSLDIKSYYALVRAGSNKKIRKEFPSNQFTHAILCVPVEKDTVWLECTSQSIPFGFLGDFTDDRDVLLITENGGKIAHTKIYKQEDNIQFCKALVKLDKLGKGKANIMINYGGLQYDDFRSFLNTSREDQRKELNEDLDLSNFEILDFDCSEDESIMPSAELSLELQLNKYASVSGKRLFVSLNLMNKSSFIPENKDERNIDICIRVAYHDADTIIYCIPENFKIEYTPEDVNLKTEFGEYSASVKIMNDTVVYMRNKKMHKGQYSPEKYKELVEFYKKMVKADKAKLVLKKKEI